MTLNAGILKYNDYEFSPRSHVRVASEIVYAEDERTAIYHRHRITVTDIVVPSAGHLSTSLNMGELKSKLSEVGAPLEFKDKGWGFDLMINIPGEPERDVEFGPKPRIITWNPIGHTQSCEITWECEVCVPVCLGGSPSYDGLASFVYDMTFAIDERAYTTRTITGHLIIAMTRKDGDRYAIPDSADNYRNLINIDKPDNFIRSQDYRISADKRRLDFTIIDKEQESRNPYPPGVLAIEAEHQINYNRRKMSQFPNTISMQLALVPDASANLAWQIFRQFVFSRLQQFTDANPEKWYFLTSLDVVESVFKNQFAFRVSYTVISKIDTFLADCMIFAPMPATTGNTVPGATTQSPWTWDRFAASINAAGNDGIAKLRHTPSMDRIIDLCDGASPPTGGQGGSPATVPPPTTYATFTNTSNPDPLVSWLEFDASLTEETYHEADLYSVTLGPSQLNEKDFDPNDIDDGPAGFDEDEIERKIAQGPPSMTYRWQGYAERAGRPIPNPGILTIGGIRLIPTKERKIVRKVIGTFFGVTVYGMAWDIIYRVEERPTTSSPAVPNPAEPGTTI